MIIVNTVRNKPLAPGDPWTLHTHIPLTSRYSRSPTAGEPAKKGGPMNDFSEKRKHDRIEFDTPISYSSRDETKYHKAFMHNFGTDGMCFESDVPVTPGTKLNVKTVTLRSICMCKVKWCKMKDSGKYEIGMEFDLKGS